MTTWVEKPLPLRTGRLGFVLAVCWAWGGAPVFGQAPTEGAGMIEVPDRASSFLAPLYLWEPAHLYEKIVGSPTTEIFDPNAFPMTNVRGIAAVPNSGHPLGSSAFIWRDQGVFHHMPTAANPPVEILDPNGNPIANPNGVVWTRNLSGFTPTGSDAWIYNGAGLFLHQPPTTGTVEITDSAGFPIADIRGVIGTVNDDPAHPTGENLWIYNPGGTFLHQTGSTQTVEITDASGNSLSNIRGIVGTLDVTSPTNTAVFLWNGQSVYVHQVSTTTANSITVGGSPISDVRGMITFLKTPGPMGSAVMFWNPSGVYLFVGGSLTASEITGPGGQSIGNTRGIVATPNATSLTGTDLWIWTGAAVYLHVPGSTTTAEILDPLGFPITSVRGIVGGADNSGGSPTGTAVFIYTDSQVLLHLVGTTSTVEVTDANGSSLSNVRGVMSAPDNTTVTGSSTWFWNGASVQLHQLGTNPPQTVEMTDLGGFPILNTWGMINSEDGTTATGRSVWARTDAFVFRHLVGSTQADEVLSPLAGSIPSPSFVAPSTGLAAVHNVRDTGGGEGAGQTQDDPPYEVSFVGYGSGQAVERSSAAPPCPLDLVTTVAGSGMQIIRSPGGSVLQNDHVAILMTPPPDTVLCGACCDALGGCTDMTTAASCQGTYMGDGSGCFGDLNGDGMDDLCAPPTPSSGYIGDDGTGDANIGIQHPSGSADKHWMAWLNHFQTNCTTGDKITQVKIAFGNVALGTPLGVHVWVDPNGDGNPNDAADVMVFASMTNVANSNTFQVFDIPDVNLPSGSFFVGALMRHDHGEMPARIDTDGTDTVGFFDPLDGESWVVGTVNDLMIDPNFLAKPTYHLTLRSTVDPPIGGGNWMIRAVTTSGACCEPGQVCSVRSECECVSPVISGVYQGDNTLCVPNPCFVTVDCNANGFDDATDIASGRSSDVNSNGIPDECEVTLPFALLPEPSGVGKNRFVSFVVPVAVTRGVTAIRAQLVSLHHPPSPPPGTPSFAAFENTYRYVNSLPPLRVCVGGPSAGALCTVDADCSPLGTCGSLLHTCPDASGTTYRCAKLGCQPEYRDWSSELAGQVMHVTGDPILPSSIYDLSQIRPICGSAPAADTCTAASPWMSVETTTWGDHVGPANGPPDGVANVLDISAVKNKLLAVPILFSEPRLWKKESMNWNPATHPINVVDLGYTVDAVKAIPFNNNGAFTITVCP